jgi:uncharacterized protein (TIGR03437 family)
MRLLINSILILAISCCGFGQTYTIQTFAGGALPNNIAGTSASLGPVNAVALDTNGNAYVSAQDYGIVLRLDAATGLLAIVAGTGVTGYSGDNGPATSAELSFVTGIALDGDGNLFILDQGRVREVSGGIITTVAGDGTFGYSGDGGPATAGQWRQPVGIAADATGAIYIADSGNNRIRKVAHGVITTVAGNGKAGYSGDGGPSISAELSSPNGVAVDTSGNLYIADLGNSRIRKVSGGVITTVAGNGMAGFSGDGGSATSAALSPDGIAVDSVGNLYISDESSRVREVLNGVISTVAGNGTAGFNGDLGAATSVELNIPLGVGVDSSHNLFIADYRNDRVRKVALGVSRTVAGGGGVGDGGQAIEAQLASPLGIALDSSGKLYIADPGNNRVRAVSDGIITTVAGIGTPGTSGNNGPADVAELSNPLAVAADSAGDVYIADGSSVREVSNRIIASVVGSYYGAGCGSGPAASAQLSIPYGIALDPSGNLYIADTYNDCIREITNGTIASVAGTALNPGYSGDNGPALRAQLNQPQGVALDAAGNLYIADSYNYVVRRVSNGVITTVAGNGTQGFSGDDGPATSAQLFIPTSITLDAAGNLFIVDNVNSRVRKVAGGVITTIAGTGAQGFAGDNGPATAASLDGPWGIAVDQGGNVFVSDSGSNRIRMLVPSGPSNCTYAVSPFVFTAVKAGASFIATVQTPAGCTWAAAGVPGWIALSGDAVNTGPGNVTVNISANAGNERTVYLSIAGISVQVTQQGLLSINAGGVVNAASYVAPVAPGSIAAVFGDFPLASPVTDTDLPLPFSMSNFELSYPSGSAPLFFVSAGQANIQIPWELAGQSQTTLAAATMPTNQSATPQTVTLAPFAPGIFSMNSQGTGQGAILDASYHLVDASNPAAAGSTVLIYCTGLGEVTNQPPTGSPASLTVLSSTPALPTVTIGGVPANVGFSGLAPGYVGLYQVNAQVPAGLAASGAVPVSISMDEAASNTVTIAVQ